MTRDKLFALIQQAGMTPVPIIQDGEMDVITYFRGELDQYLLTAKAIGSTAVFVEDMTFQEYQFLYNPDEDEDEESDSEGEIDLAAISPALARYKKYLGQNFSFSLAAKGGADDLRFSVDQPWMRDFDNERERAEGEAVLGKFKKE